MTRSLPQNNSDHHQRLLSKLWKRPDVDNSENLRPLKEAYFISTHEYSNICSPHDDEMFVITADGKCVALTYAMYHESIWFSDNITNEQNLCTTIPSTLICCPLSGATVVCEGYWDPTIYRIKDSCCLFSDNTNSSRLLVPLLAKSLEYSRSNHVGTYQAQLSSWQQIKSVENQGFHKILLSINVPSRLKSYVIPSQYGCGIRTSDKTIFVHVRSFTESPSSGEYQLPDGIINVRSQVFCTKSSWISLHPDSLLF